MPRRKKVAEENTEDEGPVVKKRRKSMDIGEMCHELYETLRNYKSEDGRILCETFIRAPKRRSQADYYDVVSTPMDLLKIQQKIKTDEYNDLHALTTDIELMINNAKAYYKKNSQEYKDACELWEIFIDTKNEILDNEAKDEKDHEGDRDASSSCTSSFNDADEDYYEELFTAVMKATDADGRCISAMFQLLPSRTMYPEYYKIIHEPIDLKIIATKIQQNEYQSLEEIEKDLMLLVKNAKTFNEPGSQIYKDATALKRAIQMKKAEIDQRRLAPGKSSERIRSKRFVPGLKLSAVTAALKYETGGEPPQGFNPLTLDQVPTETGESEAESHDERSDPMWTLFDTVKMYQYQGTYIADPFTKMPSKKWFPDYYREIKRPISLNKIEGKIRDAVYSSPSEVGEDLNLLFQNAKSYNRPESKIFKDATKLQKVLLAKAKELNIPLTIKEEDEAEIEQRQKKMAKKQLNVSGQSTEKKGKKSLDSIDPPVKKRMKIIIKALLNYCDDTGRALIPIFMERPSRKDYPDYYEVISNPIDMKTIDENVRTGKYTTEEALVSDLRQMFNNCRLYNEEKSQIYKDADTLERVMFDKIRELGQHPDSNSTSRPWKVSSKRTRNRNSKLHIFFDTVRDYTDSKGRKLSLIFQKLPSKTEYPDYYEVIKKPVDMDRVAMRLKNGQYDCLDDLLADFVLMFDNACKYNEPDSQIYKDALILQRIAMQTKTELTEDLEDGIPDVKMLVQELLTNLFITVYSHQDEEGRCYSDSLVELSESSDWTSESQAERRLLNLDIIKRNLDKGRYQRLDRFQEDMFEVLEKARRISRTDSQAFEDSIELQSYFIRHRDELCKNGEILSSPALFFTEKNLQTSVESLKAQKLPQEQQEAEIEQKQKKESEEKKDDEMSSSSDSTIHKGQSYYAGDFVYIEPREKGMEPHIIHIERLWRDKQGEQWLYGCWFYRPNETFHLASRKFLQKEVFKSDNFNSSPFNQVIGKCYVMTVRDYFKFKPEGFDDKDVYVCESRYSAKAKAFKKIKMWNFFPNEHTEIVPREEHLSEIRVPSVFKNGVEGKREDVLDDETKVIDKPRPNVVSEAPNSDENTVYYEQLNLPSGVYKLGDCVYVRTEHGKTLIGRIDKMWTDKEGNGYFHGPWFVTPGEIQQPQTRMFYRQEVFLSSIEDTNPLLSIVGRCSVLDFKDYTTCRVTEIPEQDVYLCESRFLEAERQIRKLPKGLKKFGYTRDVVPDEIYYFRNPVTPQKEQQQELSPLIPRVTSDNEESNDIPCPSTPRDDQNSNLSASSSTKKKSTKRLVTGYILFASEVRKSVVAANPDRSFGDISRLIGTEWRNLSAPTKSEYEERAQKQNEETAAKEAASQASMDSLPQSPASLHGENSRSGSERGLDGNVVHECLWDGCDFQFEDQQDLVDHLVQDPNGHIHQSYLGIKDNNEFQCLWPNCARVKKNVPPFPNITKLLRHVREVHVKVAAKSVPPEQRSRNYILSRRPASSPASSVVQCPPTPYTASQHSVAPSMTPQQQPHPGGVVFTPPPPTPLHHHHMVPPSPMTYSLPAQNAAPVQTLSALAAPLRPPEPIFVAPPQRPQKLLHTYTYIKYIEGLQPDNKYISNWDSQLKATKENTLQYDAQKLPTHWLGNGVGNHGNAVNALWALRDFMLRDALNISKIT